MAPGLNVVVFVVLVLTVLYHRADANGNRTFYFQYSVVNQLVLPYFNKTATLPIIPHFPLVGHMMVATISIKPELFTNFSVTTNQDGIHIDQMNGVSTDNQYTWKVFKGANPLTVPIRFYQPLNEDNITFKLTEIAP